MLICRAGGTTHKEVTMSSAIQETQKRNSIPATKSERKPTTALPRGITHEQIAVRAHELYARSGYQAGRDVEFWLEAERQLREDLDA
jgi:Protein of unknown function (DUF2934)